METKYCINDRVGSAAVTCDHHLNECDVAEFAGAKGMIILGEVVFPISRVRFKNKRIKENTSEQ